MANSLSDRWAVTFANFIIRYRWFVIILTVAAVMGTASGDRHLEFANNYRIFFSADNPELINFERFQAIYTKNDNILVAVQTKNSGLFTQEQADAVERITAGARKTPYAI